jgi:hypothetical protein
MPPGSLGVVTSRREEIADNLAAVRDRIERACAAAGRDASEITLIVVTKFHPASDIGHLLGLGITDIGENRDQEARAKVDELDPAVRKAVTLHFIGQLQTNKARHVAAYADCVQSVDRPKLAGALDRAAAERGPLDVLLQVDLGEGEDAGRGGILPAGLMDLADQVGESEHLALRGLMAVAPFGLDDAGTAAAFARLADLAASVRERHPQADILSAGMSGDLELAVAAGATHLRVGTAILGSRPDPR